MTRRELLSLPGVAALAGQDLPDFRTPLIHAPRDPASWPEWRTALNQWRTATRSRLHYDDALYRRPDFAWVPSSFACSMLMVWDLEGQDMDGWLAAGEREFGSYDSVVFWHAYPRIGLDDRNQYDFYRDMPGGLRGMRELVEALHRKGVKAYIDYNPWDTGTRREGMPDLEVLAELVGSVAADGIFLDTMSKGASEFRAKLDAVRRGVALEGEAELPLESLHDHHLSWAQGFRDSWAPGVLRNKWVERRHMLHQINRWDRDHSPELHTAWMNGSGMIIWENVFGTMMPWCERDKTLLRSMLPVQRRYASIFSGENWTPLVETSTPDVFASLWEGDGIRLWTLVNRSRKPVSGVLMPGTPVMPCFDLIAGEAVSRFAGRIEPRGVGAFVEADERRLGPDFQAFLAAQKDLGTRARWTTVIAQRSTTLKAPDLPPASTDTSGMLPVAPVRFHFVVKMRVRECGFYESTTDIDQWSSYQYHEVEFQRTAALDRYAIDKSIVTNSEYSEFLKATGYRPSRPENFLRHWDNGRPPAGKEASPVVYVDLDDARAYAKWTGKRLPLEEEWQHAAESGDIAWGLAWEWTESERTDERNRWSMIRGGSPYKAEGSGWYMDGGKRSAQFAAKLLLFWPGADRFATVGFRCAK